LEELWQKELNSNQKERQFVFIAHGKKRNRIFYSIGSEIEWQKGKEN
jgi:hypothetical protein